MWGTGEGWSTAGGAEHVGKGGLSAWWCRSWEQIMLSRGRRRKPWVGGGAWGTRSACWGCRARGEGTFWRWGLTGGVGGTGSRTSWSACGRRCGGAHEGWGRGDGVHRRAVQGAESRNSAAGQGPVSHGWGGTRRACWGRRGDGRGDVVATGAHRWWVMRYRKPGPRWGTRKGRDGWPQADIVRGGGGRRYMGAAGAWARGGEGRGVATAHLRGTRGAGLGHTRGFRLQGARP